MKLAAFAAAAAFLAWDVAAHATFQALWVDGVDMGSQCARLPLSNSPVTNVASSDIRCNTGVKPVSLKCVVAAGSAVTVEMHQQPNDRSCGSDAIGGAHYGPVSVYLSKVSDATSADPSGGWFKIFEDSWAKKPSGGAGDDDFWGTKDLNKCCGKMSLKIPADIPAGDYLLRAEALALHTAASSGQAQFYMTCFQLQVTGGGSASPATVSFPGAYKASDPGILVDIHAPLATYIAPGPSVYSGGGMKSAGGSCAACESTCSPGKGTVGTATSVPGSGSTPTTTASSPGSSGGSGGGGSSGCSVAKYGQCGGTGYTGCTTCASGSSCSSSNQYYSQCL